MKKVFLVLFLTLSIPTTTWADSASIEMVNLTLIDQNTQEELRSPDGVKGDMTIRCYGYKWKELGYGEGFDQNPPADYTPAEVYTIKEYYKNNMGLTDLTSYIRLMNINYCDLELVTAHGKKYVGEKYNLKFPHEDENFVPLVDRSDCKFSDAIMQGEVCQMKVEVKQVDQFSWEKSGDLTNGCLNGTCPINETDSLNNNNVPYQTGMWARLRCMIINLLGGKC